MLQTIAALASIIALGIVLVQSAWTTIKINKTKSIEAEIELEKAFDRLASVGNSLSSRSDLGFLVLIDLGTLQNTLSGYRHLRNTFNILSILLLAVMNICIYTFEESINKYIIIALLLLLIITFIIEHIVSRNEKKANDFYWKYYKKIHVVWQKPINKRLKKHE